MVIDQNACDAKVAIVILNYQNSSDSLACVKSICKQSYPELAGILVVDNGSSKENFKVLTDGCKECSGAFKLVRLHKNLGFARGNNVGISYARREWNTDYILIVNNDTLFTDPGLLSKLLAHAKDDVAMIGPAIRLRNGFIQKEYLVPTGVLPLFYRWISLMAQKNHSDLFSIWLKEKWRRKEFLHKTLHGCAILFTPVFFKFYTGMYSKTFLYAEEEILLFQLQKVGLLQCYVPEAEIFHLEDQSTIIAFEDVEKSKLHYSCRSCGHALAAKILPYRILKRMC